MHEARGVNAVHRYLAFSCFSSLPSHRLLSKGSAPTPRRLRRAFRLRRASARSPLRGALQKVWKQLLERRAGWPGRELCLCRPTEWMAQFRHGNRQAPSVRAERGVLCLYTLLDRNAVAVQKSCFRSRRPRERQRWPDRKTDRSSRPGRMGGGKAGRRRETFRGPRTTTSTRSRDTISGTNPWSRPASDRTGLARTSSP